MGTMIPNIYPGYFYTILSECKSRWLRKEADFIAFAADISAPSADPTCLLIDPTGEETAVDDKGLSCDIGSGV